VPRYHFNIRNTDAFNDEYGMMPGDLTAREHAMQMVNELQKGDEESWTGYTMECCERVLYGEYRSTALRSARTEGVVRAFPAWLEWKPVDASPFFMARPRRLPQKGAGLLPAARASIFRLGPCGRCGH
jgi:hypothetical protein